MKKTLGFIYLSMLLLLLLETIQTGNILTEGWSAVLGTSIVVPLLLLTGITAIQGIVYAIAKPFNPPKNNVIWVIANTIFITIKSILMTYAISILFGFAFSGLFGGYYIENVQWNDFTDQLYSSLIMMLFVIVLAVSILVELIITLSALKKKNAS